MPFVLTIISAADSTMTEVVKQEFVTPDRGPHHSSASDEKDGGLSQDMTEKEKAMQVVTVTPAESTAAKKEDRDSPLAIVANNQVESPEVEDRKVRFDKDDNADISDSPSSTGSQRGLGQIDCGMNDLSLSLLAPAFLAE